MQKPWIGIQHWKHPVFMHWPVSHEVLRPLVPEPFQLDTIHGSHWVSIVAFKATQTSPRWGSSLLSLGPYWQLNIRTYIRFFEEPAVYFLDVYTNSRLTALGANFLMSLPFNYANFGTSKSDSSLNCRMRQHNRWQASRFSMQIYPSSEPFSPSENTLEYWLTERYHFYAIKGKHIVKASISHKPWFLQEAEHTITHNHLMDFMPSKTNPLVHIGDSQTTYLYPYKVKGRYLM